MLIPWKEVSILGKTGVKNISTTVRLIRSVFGVLEACGGSRNRNKVFLLCLLTQILLQLPKKRQIPPSSIGGRSGSGFFFEVAFEPVLCHIQFVVRL
jgi:hypothetical protein